MGPNEILRPYVMEHERPIILNEAHAGVTRVYYAGKDTVHKILQAGLLWPTLHADAREYRRNYDVCQRTGKPSRPDEMLLVPHITL